jgi:hypothetical protein
MYLYAACLGEARHARDTVARERFVASKTSNRREDWFANVVLYRPTKENLETLISVFSQEWRSGYGGEAWQDIAIALTEYEKTPPAAWLDHVVDLEHNNGTAFSKPDGEATIFFSVFYPDRFSCFLDYKFAKDILVKKPSFEPYLKVSPRIHSLLTKYSLLFKKPEVKHAVPELENLSDYSVEWGDERIVVEEKWATWASIDKKNKPNTEMLMSNAGFYEFYPSYYTKDDFLKKVENCKRRLFSSLNPKLVTPYFKAKIAKMVAKYVKRNIGKCKMPKAPITYKVIPCKVKSYKMGEVILSFDLPYQNGYGKKVKGGFEVDVPMYVDSNIAGQEGYVEVHYGDLVLWLKNGYHYANNSILEALID